MLGVTRDSFLCVWRRHELSGQEMAVGCSSFVGTLVSPGKEPPGQLVREHWQNWTTNICLRSARASPAWYNRACPHTLPPRGPGWTGGCRPWWFGQLGPVLELGLHERSPEGVSMGYPEAQLNRSSKRTGSQFLTGYWAFLNESIVEALGHLHRVLILQDMF